VKECSPIDHRGLSRIGISRHRGNPAGSHGVAIIGVKFMRVHKGLSGANARPALPLKWAAGAVPNVLKIR
jgi:hypothetical protein